MGSSGMKIASHFKITTSFLWQKKSILLIISVKEDSYQRPVQFPNHKIHSLKQLIYHFKIFIWISHFRVCCYHHMPRAFQIQRHMTGEPFLIFFFKLVGWWTDSWVGWLRDSLSLAFRFLESFKLIIKIFRVHWSLFFTLMK